ncbi:MAG: hypothetical protein ACLUFL_06215 [Flavonifractor plautii]
MKLARAPAAKLRPDRPGARRRDISCSVNFSNPNSDYAMKTHPRSSSC